MRPPQGPAAAADCAASGGLRRAAAGLALAMLMGGTAPPPAAAAPPALPAFAARAALEPAPGAEGLQRVVLPLAVLQQLQTADRRDLRVLNGAGEPVPMAWAGEPALPPAEAAAGRPLPLFVWPAAGSTGPAPTAAVAGDAEVRVELGADGAVVRVLRRSAASAATAAQAAVAARSGASASTGLAAGTPAGASDWLLDQGPPGRQGSDPRAPAALLLHWSSPPEGLVRRVQVLASADAQHWAPAGSGTLLDLPAQNGGAPVQQRRLALPPLSDGQRYLRLQADAPLALTRAEAVAAAAVPASALEEAHFKPTRSGPREWMLDSGAVLPVVRLHLHLPQDNAVWPLALAQRLGPADDRPGSAGTPAWQPLPGTTATITAYRLLRGGERVESPALVLAAQPARHWRLTLDERIAAPEAGPELTLAWVAPQLLFATRGAGPFSLVFGAADAPAATLARSELLPGYRPGDEFALPLARLGPVQQQPVQQPSALQRLQADLASRPQQAVLWLVLALAVVLLAALAWRLARDLKAAPGGG